MVLYIWWWFLVMVFVLCGMFGLNMLYIFGCSVGLGFCGSVLVMVGCLLVMLLVLVVFVVGLSVLLYFLFMLFEVLCYFGVVYLVWFGIKVWCDSCWFVFMVGGDVELLLVLVYGVGVVFRGGLWVGLSNFKLLLFVVVFLLQFVDLLCSQVVQYSVLVVIFVVCELFWYVMYVVGGYGLCCWFVKLFVWCWFECLVGSVFLVFVVVLLCFWLC